MMNDKITGIYEAFQAVSTKLWSSLFFHSRMLWMTTKNDLQQFLDFFWKFHWQQWSKSSWDSGRYRFFWTLHHKFFDEKKNFWSQFHRVQSFISGSTSKTNKIKSIFSGLRWNGHIPWVQIFFSFFQNFLFSKFFTRFFFQTWKKLSNCKYEN